MPKAHRKERIGDLLREQIAKILYEEFHAPEGTVVTVTLADVADDLETAAILVSVFPDSETESAMERLENFAGEVQYRLMKRIRFKPIPRIRFVPDKGIANADSVDQAFYKLREE